MYKKLAKVIKEENMEEDHKYSNSPIHPIKQDVWEQTCAQLSLQSQAANNCQKLVAGLVNWLETGEVSLKSGRCENAYIIKTESGSNQ